jgi:intracellular sulfur oxidation DsrE/DsrF family protein
MENNDGNMATNRRTFIGSLATGAIAMSLSTIGTPIQAMAKSEHFKGNDDDPDAWFNKINGKHRIVFDVTEPHDILPFAWPRVFLMTNEKTGTPSKENSVVVIFRHNAIPYAMKDEMWSKYKFGDVFKINDMATKASAIRNPFWMPKPGEYQVPGIGAVPIGINELQESGVMFCCCDVALTVYSAVVAQDAKMNAADVKKDWVSSLLPGIQVVPSGVWAVGRAQEHGCAYCFAG